MSCKVGGLVLLRRNDLAGDQELMPAAVSEEPLIHSGRDLQVRAKGESTDAQPENRGDVAAHGFWRRGATTIFDVRITDTDAPTYRNRDPVKGRGSTRKGEEGRVPRVLSGSPASLHPTRVLRRWPAWS